MRGVDQVLSFPTVDSIPSSRGREDGVPVVQVFQLPTEQPPQLVKPDHTLGADPLQGTVIAVLPAGLPSIFAPLARGPLRGSFRLTPIAWMTGCKCHLPANLFFTWTSAFGEGHDTAVYHTCLAALRLALDRTGSPTSSLARGRGRPPARRSFNPFSYPK
jgi:hypothetical protein